MLKKIFLGISIIFMLVTLILLMLKLTDNIECSWFFVLLPLEIYAGFFLLLIITTLLTSSSEADEEIERIKEKDNDRFKM